MVAVILATVGSSFAAAMPGQNAGSVEKVLVRHWRCGPSVTLRSQALTREAETAVCTSLSALEQRFHRLLGTKGKPVANNFNMSLRANIYRSKA